MRVAQSLSRFYGTARPRGGCVPRLQAQLELPSDDDSDHHHDNNNPLRYYDLTDVRDKDCSWLWQQRLQKLCAHALPCDDSG